MKVVNYFEILTVLTVFVFLVPTRFKQALTLLLSLALSAITGYWAFQSLVNHVMVVDRHGGNIEPSDPCQIGLVAREPAHRRLENVQWLCLIG